MLEALFLFIFATMETCHWQRAILKATATCLSCAHLCSVFSSLPMQNANFLNH